MTVLITHLLASVTLPHNVRSILCHRPLYVVQVYNEYVNILGGKEEKFAFRTEFRSLFFSNV